MGIPASVAILPSDVQTILSAVVKPKFNAYFAVTSTKAGGPVRAVPDSGGQPWFVYPDNTMIADLVFLWSAFSDVYQAVGGPEPLARVVRSEALLLEDFQRIMEGHSPSSPDASFWHFPGGCVSLQNALADELSEVLRTLRNGYAHSHWFYANLSALDYWKQLGWDTANAHPDFDLSGRPAKNYMLYIADARQCWNSQQFWAMEDLRIVVTPAVTLRYHLHLFLNFILNGSRQNVFSH